MSRLIGPIYALGLLALGLLLAALWLGPGSFASLRHWQAPAAQSPQLDDVYTALLQAHPAAAADYPELLQRPLFSPTRRPPQAPGAEPAPPPEPEANPFENLHLLGVVRGPTLNGAMLAQDDTTRFLPLNEKLDGWTLKRLAADHVVFERQGRQERVNLPTAHLGDAAVAPDAARTLANTRAGVGSRPPAAAPRAEAADDASDTEELEELDELDDDNLSESGAAAAAAADEPRRAAQPVRRRRN